MDITTLAAAKAYTDKKVKESGGGGLPVIELTTLPSSDGAVLTAEETAQLEVAMASKACVVLIYNEGYPWFTLVCAKCEIDGIAAFAGQMVWSNSNGVYETYDFQMAIVDGAGIAIAYPKGS